LRYLKKEPQELKRTFHPKAPAVLSNSDSPTEEQKPFHNIQCQLEKMGMARGRIQDFLKKPDAFMQNNIIKEMY
jgi:hypothetical protein